MKLQDFCSRLRGFPVVSQRLQPLEAIQQTAFTADVLPQQPVYLQAGGHRGACQDTDLVEFPLQSAQPLLLLGRGLHDCPLDEQFSLQLKGLWVFSSHFCPAVEIKFGAISGDVHMLSRYLFDGGTSLLCGCSQTSMCP